MPFPCPDGHTEPLHPCVQKLVKLLTEQGRLGSLDAAVKAAVQEDISELTDWKIFNGHDFLQYASCLLKYWIPNENSTSTFIYEVLTVFYCESFPDHIQHALNIRMPCQGFLAMTSIARQKICIIPSTSFLNARPFCWWTSIILTYTKQTSSTTLR